MKKKIVAIVMCAALCCTVFLGADVAAEASEADAADVTLDGTWPEETIKIGVEVYDTTDLSVIAYEDYFDYLSEYYNLEFMFSESISSAEDELNFVDSCAAAGCQAYFGGYNCSMAECVNAVLNYGMYYWGAERSLDEQFADNPLYLGGFFPKVTDEALSDKNGDYLIGYEMAYQLAELGTKHVVYCNGGASIGIQMFVDRQTGFFDGIAKAQEDGYDIEFDQDADIIEGWPGTDDYAAAQSKALSMDYDAVAVSSSGVDVWVQPIFSAGKAGEIKLAGVGAVDESLKDIADDGTLCLLIYECEEVVFGNAIPMFINAINGHSDIVRLSDTEVEPIVVSRWYITDGEEYDSIYDLHSSGDYYITAEDMAQLFPEFNPDITYEGFMDYYDSFTLENCVD